MMRPPRPRLQGAATHPLSRPIRRTYVRAMDALHWTEAVAAGCALLSLRLFFASSGSFQFGGRRAGTVMLLVATMFLAAGILALEGSWIFRAGN